MYLNGSRFVRQAGDDYLDGRDMTGRFGRTPDLLSGGLPLPGHRALSGEAGSLIFAYEAARAAAKVGAPSSGSDVQAQSISSPQPAAITGTNGDDVLVGSDGVDDYLEGLGGNDVLNGRGGADTTDGGPGDDTHYVDNANDVVIEAAGGGFDKIITTVSFSLENLPEIEVLADGNTAMTAIVTLIGNDFANTLYGNVGNNLLEGRGGDDVLAGHRGTNRLVGGTGNDWYIVGYGNDTVVEAAGEGAVDRVFAGASYALGAGVEIEILSTDWHAGTAAIDLTGNAFSQDIIGNDGANVLVGGGGDDWMYGRSGNDTFHVDNANDRVFESAGQGYDTVLASATYVLHAGASIERLATANASGTAAINLTGNEFSQDIVGNAGNNALIGGGGDDWFYGGAGDDLYYVDSANDKVIESAGQGFDSVYVNLSYVLHSTADVEFLSADSLGGTSAINLTGNHLAQEVWGNMGDNYLDGKEGSDTLFGIGGSDIFAFTTALGPDNVDRIFGFSTSEDRIGLDDAVFAGLAAGALAEGAFRAGAAAQDADDRIIYDQATGALYYDADGSGAGAAVQFASLQPGTSLAASDFIIF